MDAAVIIVGAGPSGLMLAGELRLAGVEVVVLERLAGPSGESRALGFTARAMEVFDQRGLLPRLGEVEVSPQGHFGGIPMDYSVIDGGHFGARGIVQSRTETMLDDWAAELGADIRRSHEVTGLTDHGDSVEVEVRAPDGVKRLRAAYLVGCDGGRSTVRRLAGIDFPGTKATREMYLADVKGCNLRSRYIGEKVTGGMAMSAPLGDGIDRIIACERDTPPRPRRDDRVEFAEVATAWQRLTGEDISGGEALWASSFTNATRQASEYRRGRVLLAGDAAHTHVPAGGQGLSVGVQDVANLGWKLAAEVNGWAPEGLLDTYHGERHPVGERLLMNTHAQEMLYLGGEEIQPLRGIFAELMGFDDVRRHLAGMVSGLDIRYDTGPGDHPLLGARLPAAELVGAHTKTTTIELLHRARGVLLDFADDASLRGQTVGWADRVDVVTATPHAATQLEGTAALLVRPDGHVAWAAPGSGELDTALRRWFGAPR